MPKVAMTWVKFLALVTAFTLVAELTRRIAPGMQTEVGKFVVSFPYYAIVGWLCWGRAASAPTGSREE